MPCLEKILKWTSLLKHTTAIYYLLITACIAFLSPFCYSSHHFYQAIALDISFCCQIYFIGFLRFSLYKWPIPFTLLCIPDLQFGSVFNSLTSTPLFEDHHRWCTFLVSANLIGIDKLGHSRQLWIGSSAFVLRYRDKPSIKFSRSLIGHFCSRDLPLVQCKAKEMNKINLSVEGNVKCNRLVEVRAWIVILVLLWHPWWRHLHLHLP